MDKTPIDRENFMAVLNDCGYSLRSLYRKWTTPPCSNRQLRRYLLDGSIPLKTLYAIAQYIDVSPEVLAGHPIGPVNDILDVFINYCNSNYGFVAGIAKDRNIIKNAIEKIIFGG